MIQHEYTDVAVVGGKVGSAAADTDVTDMFNPSLPPLAYSLLLICERRKGRVKHISNIRVATTPDPFW